MQEVTLRDSRDATTVAEYANALRRFTHGDRAALQPFQDVRITVRGHKVSLLTEPQALDQLANAGVLSFESLYARAS